MGLGDTVRFRGHVAHDELLATIRAGDYDAMVLTSLELPGGLMEGIPVALMEAMALGLPVITTDTGSIGELVDESCGRIVPQRDVDRIAAAIAELATSPALRGSSRAPPTRRCALTSTSWASPIGSPSCSAPRRRSDGAVVRENGKTSHRTRPDNGSR